MSQLRFCKKRGCVNESQFHSLYCETHEPSNAVLPPPNTSAAHILQAAAKHMEDRAVTYDLPQGERSMHRTVAMFNTLTDHLLTDEQGWLFMTCLKMVRAQAGGYRADSYEDGAAYFALAGESAAQERV